MIELSQLDRPAYTVAEAGRLVGLAAGRVRRWLGGCETKRTYASFLDLVDLLFVERFLDYGIPLQRVRHALDKARKVLDTKHFARQTFFTDGRTILLRFQERADEDRGGAMLEQMSRGQWVIASVIQQLAQQIDFDAPRGLAKRWYPLGRDKPVVLDPKVAFGAPSIVDRGVKTINIYDFFVAENENLASARTWWGLTDAEIQAAVDFERQLVA